eukprot:CAMPEP_0179433382 /NCGR_PEP_ID=MMETSP0799-20121207/17805_1 /TAXON_ID=46947 /ORGANISM="Geminigera cryophila, Strain CCMP2564" /LENGTH=598 /DNA_ID=CAMNT_0021211323 /DNA_START=174 /DNA_END=1969 /DNA_ORIENTATION=-
MSQKVENDISDSDDLAWPKYAGGGSGGCSKGTRAPKKIKKAAGTGDTDMPSHDALVSRCARGDLESLLLGKILDGTSTSISDILALLPEVKQTNKPPPAVVVNKGKERVGTGRFDALDEEVLLAIMSRIPFLYRLACTTSVCKPWRSLRDHISLWTEVKVTGSVGSFVEYRLNKSETNPAVGCSGKGVERLVEWLPRLNAVTKLDLVSKDCMPPDAVKKVLANFCNLTSLSLRGKKVSNAVLKAFAQGNKAAALTELILADKEDYFRGCDWATQKEVHNLIKSAPLLEVLALPSVLPFDGIHNATKEARKGGQSLIRRLTIHGLPGFEGTSWTDIARMGTTFPELESLSLNTIGMPTWGLGLDDHIVNFPILSAMPRLRTLHIMSCISYSGHHFSSDRLNKMIKCLLAACPVLEDLKIVHGQQSISSFDRKNGMKVESFPEPGDAFLDLPRTLRCLRLQDMILLPEHFNEMPFLTSVTLINCGEQAEAAKQAVQVKTIGKREDQVEGGTIGGRLTTTWKGSSDSDWWQTVVLKNITSKNTQNMQIFVAYVRGSEGDNEWLSAIGVRVRTSLTSFWDYIDRQVGGKKDMAARKSQQRLE